MADTPSSALDVIDMLSPHAGTSARVRTMRRVAVIADRAANWRVQVRVVLLCV
jgi:hypothetical protein